MAEGEKILPLNATEDGKKRRYEFPRETVGRKQEEKSKFDPKKVNQFVGEKAYMDMAKLFLQSKYKWEFGNSCTLQYFGESFYKWDGRKYCPRPRQALVKELYEFLPQLRCRVRNTEGPVQANREVINNVLDALQAEVYVEASETPAWIGSDRPLGDLKDYFSCYNGIVNTRTRKKQDHDPRFFVLNSREFSFDPQAKCPQFLEHLSVVCKLTEQDRAFIQEWFGYCQTSDTRYQKAVYVVGPPRAGKGTIFGDVLRYVTGEDAFSDQDFATVAERFQSYDLVGKNVCHFGDERVERSMTAKLTSFLLRLIGGDRVKVEEKGGKTGGMKLTTKVQVLSNDFPSFYDNSGTIATRFYYVQFTESFLGKEVLNLAHDLLGEASGILNWALDGLDRLREEGFTEPSRHQELQKDFKESGSTILTFVRDQCELGSNKTAYLELLYVVYIRWAHKQNRKGELNYENFCSKFRSAFPELEYSRPRSTTGRQRLVHGIGIRDWLGDKETPKGKALLGMRVDPVEPVVPVPLNSFLYTSPGKSSSNPVIEGTGTSGTISTTKEEKVIPLVRRIP